MPSQIPVTIVRHNQYSHPYFSDAAREEEHSLAAGRWLAWMYQAMPYNTRQAFAELLAKQIAAVCDVAMQDSLARAMYQAWVELDREGKLFVQVDEMPRGNTYVYTPGWVENIPEQSDQPRQHPLPF